MKREDGSSKIRIQITHSADQWIAGVRFGSMGAHMFHV
jgi:hypothetical protein